MTVPRPALAFFALLCAALPARAETLADLVRDYTANAGRFRHLRCEDDLAPFEAFARRIEAFDDGSLDAEALADALCLRHLVERAEAELRTFRRRETDPAMVLPTGDPLARALEFRPAGGDDLPAAVRARAWFARLADRVSRAPAAGMDLDRAFAVEARKRAGELQRAIGGKALLLLRHLPGPERELWRAVLADAVRALEDFRARLKAAVAALPEPTEEEARARRKRDLDFRIRHELLWEEDSGALLRRAARFFLDTERELEREAERIAPGRSWRELLRDAEADHPPRGGLVDTARALAEEALRFVVENDLVTVPENARAFEVVPGDPSGSAPFAHYRPAGRGGKAAFVAVPCAEDWDDAKAAEHLRANHVHWLRVVALHEAVPGHHLQFSIAATLESPVRRLLYCSTYVEGWGLYCEEMMARHGFLGPLARLTQLRMRLWRAVRVLNAVALDHEGLDEKGAAAFLRDRVLFKDMHARKEAKMHHDRPAYFLSYAVGFWQIEALRRTCRSLWGAGYSEKRFHDAFLSFGPIPIPVIAETLRRIAAREENRPS